MSEIRTELDRIISQVEEGHSKATAKGGTPQSPKTLANLLTAIDTIPKATAPKLQAKTATPSETAQTVKPDSGYDGLSQVSVGAISKTYVGSGVTKQAAKTITPSTSSQTAVASGVYTTGAVTVAAIPSTYVKPTATKAATTYTPTTSNQTIAAGTYCSGAQTIKGDANLVAGNIKSGVSIFGVAGSYEGSGGSSGGGGGVETCTVTISNSGNYIAVLYPTYENGMFTPNYASCNYGASPAPFDMPKGHVIYIITGEGHTYLDAENAEVIFNVTDGHAGLDMMGIRVTGDVTITE